MWLLPVDLSTLTLDIDREVRLIPWHYSAAEVDALAHLLRLTVRGVRAELRLDGATLRAAQARGVTASGVLVIACAQEPGTSLSELTERLSALGPRCALVKLKDPQDMGYGWLEREVKAPLYKALSQWMRSPEHPLAGLNVKALPVMEAASLTTDPVELIDLLERTIVHRMRHAGAGVDGSDYRQSLLLAAGARLAERLARLDREALDGALDALFEGKGRLDRRRLHPGAAALEEVGLARVVAGDMRIGPLGRAVWEPRLLGALEAGLPGVTAAKLAALRRAHRAPPSLSPVVGLASVSSDEIPLAPGLDRADAARLFPGEPMAAEVVRLLVETSNLPMSRRALPAEVAERVQAALRWLETVEQTRTGEHRMFARVARGLLTLFTWCTAEALDEQDGVLRTLVELLGGAPEVSRDHVLAWAKLHHAAFLLARRRSVADVDRAEELAREALDACKRRGGPTGRLIRGYLTLAAAAAERRDYAGARVLAEQALDTAQGEGYDGPAASATELLAIILAAMDLLPEAESEARRALRVRERIGQAGGIQGALRVLAGTLLMSAIGGSKRSMDEVRRLLDRALAITEALGDKAGRAECLLGLGTLHLLELEPLPAELLAREALSLCQEITSVSGRAASYYLLGLALVMRPASDEAARALRRAVSLYERLGDAATVERVRAVLGRLPRREGGKRPASC